MGVWNGVAAGGWARSVGGAAWRCVGLAWLAGFIAFAHAETVADLYAVSVPVAEQSQGELQRAAAIGLRELAVRVSGRSAAVSDPALAAIFANATRYLEQYRYERNSGGESPWLAQLRFSAAQIDGALRGAGLPTWGGNRPALQIWLAVDDGKTRNLVDANATIAGVLSSQLRGRGLLLHLPRSFGALSADDVWQLDVAKVASAPHERSDATGEHTDGVLLGRLNQTASGTWSGSWVLGIDGQQLTAEGAGDSPSAAIAVALDRLIDNVSLQYAVAARSVAEGIVVRFTGVVGFDDYSAIMTYLHRLSLIKSANPILVRGDEMFIQLKVEGSVEQLSRQFALDNRFTPSPSATNELIEPRAMLSYRWLLTRG